MKRILVDVRTLFRNERLMWQDKKMWIVFGVIAMIPFIYCLIFLSSMMDPYGRLPDLPVALVNLDQGGTFRNQTMNIGSDIVTKLEHDKPLHFIRYNNAELARVAVSRGEVYFALIIPADFTAAALSGAADKQAKLKLFTNPGGNFFAAKAAETFGNQLIAGLNQQLSEKRLVIVSQAIDQIEVGSGRLVAGSLQLKNGSTQLLSGVGQALVGAKALEQGQQRISTAVSSLTTGMNTLGTGLRTLDAALPQQETISTLLSGSDALANGNRQLATGLQDLASAGQQVLSGARTLADASKKMADSSAANTLAPKALVEATAKLSNGSRILTTGLVQLSNGQTKAAGAALELANGSNKLNIGVQQLGQGSNQIKVAVDSMVARLPAESDLHAIDKGAQTLSQKQSELTMGLGRLAMASAQLQNGNVELDMGIQALHAGVEQLQSKLPTALSAGSIMLSIDNAAVVSNNGEAFAPYFVGVSLWIGILVSTFIFPYLLIADSSRHTLQSSRIVSKLRSPALLSAVQAIVVCGGLMLMGIHFQHPWLVVVVAVLSSWSFLAINFSLMVLFGDAGRLLSVLLLVLQISSSGGSYPIELTSSFFQIVHPWLPISSTVTALRVGISGALESQALTMIARLGLTMILALLLAMAGRHKWRFVDDDQVRADIRI